MGNFKSFCLASPRSWTKPAQEGQRDGEQLAETCRLLSASCEVTQTQGFVQNTRPFWAKISKNQTPRGSTVLLISLPVKLRWHHGALWGAWEGPHPRGTPPQGTPPPGDPIPLRCPWAPGGLPARPPSALCRRLPSPGPKSRAQQEGSPAPASAPLRAARLGDLLLASDPNLPFFSLK